MYFPVCIIALVTSTVGVPLSPLDVSWSPIDSHDRLLREVATAEIVRQSRLHFAGDAANDWVVKYAVYGIGENPYVPPLINAAQAGVRVQVLLEHRQLAHPYVTIWEDFQKAGMNVTAKNLTQLNMTQAERSAMNLVPMDVGGLFHLKIRYFRWRDIASGEQRELMFTGSFNPEDTAFQWNIETLMAISDKQIIADYLGIYDSALHGTPHTNVWREERPLNVLYSKVLAPVPTPKGALIARAKIMELIDEEREAILFPLFLVRNLDVPGGGHLLDKLCAAKQRGVFVAFVLNKDFVDQPPITGDAQATVWHMWQMCSIPTYKARIFHPFAGIHEKNAIFGITKAKIVTDTTNWSNSGFGNNQYAMPKNAETMLVIRPHLFEDRVVAATLALRFVSNFFYAIRRFAHQQACPYIELNITTGENMTVYENCASKELYGQPDWDFVPSQDELLSQLMAAVKQATRNDTAWPIANWWVEVKFPGGGARRQADVECIPFGPNSVDAFRLELVPSPESDALYVSEKTPIPFLQRLHCTLRVKGSVLHDFVHVADPAMAWEEDGVTLQQRKSDDELFGMLSRAYVEVPQAGFDILV